MDEVTRNRLISVSQQVYQEIWKPPGTEVIINNIKCKIQGLVRSDHNFAVHKIKYGQFSFLTQNPHSGSVYAKRAREGEKISWGILEPSRYMIRMEEDKVFVKQDDGSWEPFPWPQKANQLETA